MNETFWNSRILQYLTIFLSIVPIVLASLMWKKHQVALSLSGEALRTFKKQCKETIAQYFCALIAPIIFTVIQTLVANQELTANLTNGYFTSIALSGGVSLWNIYKASKDIGDASRHPGNKARMQALKNVEERNQAIYYSALLSFLIGTFGLIAYNLVPSPPIWSWFAAFLLTYVPAYSLVWSNSVTTVAAKYEEKPSLGRKKSR